MKRNSKKKLLSLIVATIMMVALMGATVSAAGNYATNRHTTSVETTSFDKLFVIDDGCSIPAATFTFTASVPEDDVVANSTTGTLGVKKGITPGNIKFQVKGESTHTDGSGTISYAANVKTDSAALTADNVTIIDDTPETGKYTAKKTMNLTFSAVAFPEPGIYRYIITESGNNPGVENDQNPSKTLDVYVEDISEGTVKQLKITNYVLYDGVVTTGPSSSTPGVVTGATKVAGFSNKYPSVSLTFGKEVTGNQGSRDKYFAFTLAVSDVPANAAIDIVFTNADASISANPNSATTCITTDVTQPTRLNADSDGNISQIYYLQDGQYITVYGLSAGMTYTITEDEEDYTKTAGITAAVSSFDKNGDNTKDALSDPTTKLLTSEDKAIYTGFTNAKSGAIPTGVILSATGLIIAALIAVVGVVFFGMRSRRRFEEE